MSCSKSCRKSEDLISNLPDNVTDEILGCLPILMVVRTSVLSKQWRHKWKSVKRLFFDGNFWALQKKEDGSSNLEKCSHIISNILLLHDGPLHGFYVDIPRDANFTIAPWLFSLAKKGIKEILIVNASTRVPIVSHIFSCNDLQNFYLGNYTFHRPPTAFKGFPKLTKLYLHDIKFSEPEIFCSLIANCHKLILLSLQNWIGMDRIVVDAPSLNSLTINGVFESLSFKNVRSLKKIKVYLKRLKKSTSSNETIKDVCLLASSCQLQYIEFNGLFLKFLAAGGISSSLPVTFNHLIRVDLKDVDLGDLSVFRYVIGMIESCPRIEEFNISVKRSKNADQHKQHKVDYNENLILKHLRQITITGISGSYAELQLIEHLLFVSEVLEELLFKCDKLDAVAELMVSRVLMQFTRASRQASVVCMEN